MTVSETLALLALLFTGGLFLLALLIQLHTPDSRKFRDLCKNQRKVFTAPPNNFFRA